MKKKITVSLLAVVLAASAYAGHQELSVTHHIKFLSPAGDILYDYGVQTNMITDQGLQQIADMPMNVLGQYFHWGDGTTPNGRNSGAVTVSVTGTNAVASGTLFESADTNGFGREIVFSGGAVARITGYTSDTAVTLNKALTVTDETVDIYRVEQVSLENELAVTNEYSTPNSGCGNITTVLTTDGDIDWGYANWWRTGVCPSSLEGETISEIGISYDGAPTNLFARLVLDTPVVIPADEGYLVDKATISFKVKVNERNQPSPVTGITNSCSKHLEWQADSAYGYMSRITDTTGDAQAWNLAGAGPVDPYYTTVYLMFTHRSDTSNPISSTYEACVNGVKDDPTYTQAPFSKTRNWSITNADGFGTFRTMADAASTSGIGDNDRKYYRYRVVFDGDVPIPTGAEYNMTYTSSWGRAH